MFQNGKHEHNNIRSWRSWACVAWSRSNYTILHKVKEMLNVYANGKTQFHRPEIAMVKIPDRTDLEIMIVPIFTWIPMFTEKHNNV